MKSNFQYVSVDCGQSWLRPGHCKRDLYKTAHHGSFGARKNKMYCNTRAAMYIWLGGGRTRSSRTIIMKRSCNCQKLRIAISWVMIHSSPGTPPWKWQRFLYLVVLGMRIHDHARNIQKGQQSPIITLLDSVVDEFKEKRCFWDMMCLLGSMWDLLVTMEARQGLNIMLEVCQSPETTLWPGVEVRGARTLGSGWATVLLEGTPDICS